MISDLYRIANALEHLALSTMQHDPKGCAICRAKNRPIKKQPASVVQTDTRQRAVEAQIRLRKLLAGPEQPVGDSFKYRELNKS